MVGAVLRQHAPKRAFYRHCSAGDGCARRFSGTLACAFKQIAGAISAPSPHQKIGLEGGLAARQKRPKKSRGRPISTRLATRAGDFFADRIARFCAPKLFIAA
jgi:hypothetical protein